MRATTAAKAEVKDTSKPSIGTKLLVITFRMAFILTLMVLVSVAVWAVLALVGGLIGAGDPITMIQEWFKASSGS